MVQIARILTIIGVLVVIAPSLPSYGEGGDEGDDGGDARPSSEAVEKKMMQVERLRNLRLNTRASQEKSKTKKADSKAEGSRSSGVQAKDDTSEEPEKTSNLPAKTTKKEKPKKTTETKKERKLKSDDKVRFEFPDDADLETVIKEIAAMTGRNFIYNKKDIRNQKITIITETAITIAEAYQAFISALEASGLTTVQVGPKLIKIIPRRDAVQRALDTAKGTKVPWNDAFVTRIIQLENIAVHDLQQVVSALIAKDGNSTTFSPTNSFIITDTANNIRRLVKVIQELDRAGADMVIEVVQIQYAEASDIAQVIEQLFGDSGGKSSGSSRSSIRRNKGKKKASSDSSGEPGVQISRVIPDERTNRLIIQASKSSFQAISGVVAKLDIPVSADVDQRIHVYYLENADAEEMATVLSNLSQDPSQSRRRPTTGRGASGESGGGNTNTVASLLEGSVKVTADKATNALVMVASRHDYEVLKHVIRQLDIRRRQVFVEAVIAEISVDRAKQLGLSFAAGSMVSENTPIIGGLNAGNVLLPSLESLSTGLSLGVIGPAEVPFTFVDPTGTQQTIDLPPFGVLLQALQTDSDVNVLSRPAVLAMENEEAEFISATSVAFPGSVTVSQSGLQNFSITREDVGITLRVTPKITESDYVTLQIFQEVKDIVKEQNLGNQRLIDTGKRSAKTTVIVKNKQTIVLGGLMADSDRNSESKIPLLGDIPFLGWLFRSRDQSHSKTNLLIFLTPVIINSEADMTDIYRRKMEERELFLKYYANRIKRKQEKKKINIFGQFYDSGSTKEEVPAPLPVSEDAGSVGEVEPQGEGTQGDAPSVEVDEGASEATEVVDEVPSDEGADEAGLDKTEE